MMMRPTLLVLFASAFPETSSKILTRVQDKFNVFAGHIDGRKSSLTVGGRVATRSSSTYQNLDVGSELEHIIDTCPTPHALCPLEEVLNLKESAYYSQELPMCSEYAGQVYGAGAPQCSDSVNQVNVRHGIAYHVGNVEYNDEYEGVKGWTFSIAKDENACGPNKIYEKELVDFDAEIAALTLTSVKLQKGNAKGSGDEFLDGFICHDNKLIVIPVIEGIADVTVRPVIRYALSCDQFNILNEYEIYNRNGEGTVQPILAFSIEAGDDSGNCIVSGGPMDNFKGMSNYLVWNYVGSKLLTFSTSGTFYGMFLAAASETSGISCTGDTDVNILGNVMATNVFSLSGTIKMKKLKENVES